MRISCVILAFVVVVLAVPAVRSQGVIASNRNVSVVSIPLLDLFVATAWRWAIYDDNNAIGAEEDALRLILFANNVYFAAFRGSEYRTNTNYTDISLAAFAYFVRFEALVEYNETNNITGFQLGDNGDQVLSYYPLWSVIWLITTSVSDVPLSDGSTGKLYEVTFATPDNVFSYTIKYAGAPVTVDNVTITENEFKLTWTIQYYLYSKANGSPFGQIALAGGVAIAAAATSNFRQPDPTNANRTGGIDIYENNYHGFLNVENKADTWDIQAIYVASTVTAGFISDYPGFDSGEGGFAGWVAAGVILSYSTPHATKIVHDPELGADIPDTPSSTTSGTTGATGNFGATTASGSGSSSGSTAASSTSVPASSASSVIISLGLLGVATLIALLL